MTLVDLPAPVAYPGWQSTGATSLLTVLNGTALTGAGLYEGVVFAAPKTGNISAFGWFPISVAGAGTVELRVETVGTDGLPTGTLWGTNTNLASIAPTAGTWRWDTMTAAAAVNKGDLIAIKLLYQSGTSLRPGVLNNRLIAHLAKPYRVTSTGASVSAMMACAIKYDDNTYPFCGLIPANSSTITVTVAETGTPDEVGAKIVMPFKSKLAGVGVLLGTAGRVCDINVYDSLDNVVASLTGIDTDQQGNAIGMGLQLFATPATLDAGTYRVTVSPKSGASTVTMYKLPVDASATREAMPGGLNLMWTERTNAGAWTDTNTAVPLIDLFLSQLDDGAGGGGGLLVHPGMTGGLL